MAVGGAAQNVLAEAHALVVGVIVESGEAVVY